MPESENTQDTQQAPPEGAGEQQAGQAQAPDPAAALQERIDALTAQQEQLIAALAEGKTTAEPSAQATPPPPEPAGPRVTRKEYDAMAQYASEQAQEAMRLKLAAEFGLDPGELQGDFASPDDMRRFAEIRALQSTVEELKQQLAEAQQPGASAEGGAPTPAPPAVDTGGRTGTQLPGDAALTEAYDKARALGQTAAGRRAFLEAAYKDPTRFSKVGTG